VLGVHLNGLTENDIRRQFGGQKVNGTGQQKLKRLVGQFTQDEAKVTGSRQAGLDIEAIGSQPWHQAPGESPRAKSEPDV